MIMVMVMVMVMVIVGYGCGCGHGHGHGHGYEIQSLLLAWQKLMPELPEPFKRDLVQFWSGPDFFLGVQLQLASCTH